MSPVIPSSGLLTKYLPHQVQRLFSYRGARALEKSLIVGAAQLVPLIAYKVATAVSQQEGTAAFVGTVVATLSATQTPAQGEMPYVDLGVGSVTMGLLGYGKVGVVVTAAAGVATCLTLKQVKRLREMATQGLELLATIPSKEFAVISVAGTAGLLAAGPGGYIAASTCAAFLVTR